MPRVFLVEDNAADVELFRMALEMANLQCELVVFDDGAEIIKAVKDFPGASDGAIPDLIVLDLNLPKHDGVEVLAAVRAAPQFKGVRFLILSSTPSLREREKFQGPDIIDFIIKPTDLDDYLNIGHTVTAALAPDRRT